MLISLVVAHGSVTKFDDMICHVLDCLVVCYHEKVLKQYADCYESVAYTDPTYIFSIMVCDDKLVVMYEDQESNPKYDVVGY